MINAMTQTSKHTVTHHPSEAMLMDYALGALGEGFTLAVELHLSFCEHCRKDVALMSEMAGNLMDREAAPASQSAGFDNLWNRLQDLPQEARIVHPPHVDGVPAALQPYLSAPIPEWPFKSRAPGIATVPLVKEADGTYSRIMRVAAGKKVPHHTHKGMELTVLLSGFYHDEISLYGPGDFVEHGEEVRHQPIATEEQDCICLGVTEHSLQFTKPFYNLLKPFFPV